MSPNPITCAATPAALAHHVDYVQQIIEDAHPGGVTAWFNLPAREDGSDGITSHLRYLDADNGRTYGIKAFVLSSVGGEGRLRLRVDVRGDGHDYGEVVLTTDPATDSALVSAFNTIAEINEKQNVTD